MKNSASVYLGAGILVAALTVARCHNSGSNPVGPGSDASPVVRSLVVDPTTIPAGSTAALKATVEDPDGDTFTCVFSGTGGSVSPTSTDGCSATYTALTTTSGNQDLELAVRDRRGASTSAHVALMVTPLPSPTPPPNHPSPSPSPSPEDPTPSTPAPAPTPTPTVCTYGLSPTAVKAGSGASSGSVSVTATGKCAWTAVSDVNWMKVTAGASGQGNGTVSYTLSANNTGDLRSGTISVADKTFTVNQLAVFDNR